MMSTEAMHGKIRAVFDGSECANGFNDTCKSALLTSSQDLLARYTTSRTRKSWISQRAAVNWTTMGHVGTDVNLYCKEPPTFERMCKGIHEITYVNKIIAVYLGLLHQQELETLKHRNIAVLDNPIAFIDWRSW
ncbi:putative alkaline-phosphatase-like, core domain superfamily [Plasmopara halstedii]